MVRYHKQDLAEGRAKSEVRAVMTARIIDQIKVVEMSKAVVDIDGRSPDAGFILEDDEWDRRWFEVEIDPRTLDVIGYCDTDKTARMRLFDVPKMMEVLVENPPLFLLDESLTLLDGSHRIGRAIEVGLTRIPILVGLAPESAKQIESLSIEMNAAIATAKDIGISVEYKSGQGRAAGFFSSRIRGRVGVGPCPSEKAAWEAVVERLALIQPGVPIFVSKEYGAVSFPNTQCPDGSLGVDIRKTRLEIRDMGDHFEIFELQRRYLDGTDPCDVYQRRRASGDEVRHYPSVDAAKVAVEQIIGGYINTAWEENAYAASIMNAQAQDADMPSMDDDAECGGPAPR